ncbi:MAG TPA: LysR family transcriptional regulator [Candidatus Binataceae bacterium]|nr:LysR family transcriptional regulator [Candidatus Binataceae bacterium]
MKLDIKLLKTFLALADERSFTSAGKALGLTQSAVSQQIRLLERELGAELVIRSNKLVGLTPAGEILRQSAHRILENLDQARSLIAERSTGGGGRISVGAPPSICQTLLPSVVAAFHKRFPATSFSLTAVEQLDAVERLVRRDIDFAIMPMPVRHKALAIAEAGRDEVVVVANDQSPLSRMERLQASDLQSQPMILPPNPNAEYSVWSAFMLESGVFPRITLETDNLELAIALVREGLGLTVAPRWAVAPATSRGLAALSVGKTGLWRNWSIAYPASLRLTSIHRAFLRICGDQLGSALSARPSQGISESSWERTGTTE